MDRQAALDLLELVRPDANNLQDPEFAEALADLETDASAGEVFAQRQRRDAQIAEAIVDVPVPEGLKERLLESLTKPNSTEATTLAPTVSRRRWLASATVVLASCLLAAFGIWWFQEPEPELLSLDQLLVDVPYAESEFADLEDFDGSFSATKPGGLWKNDRWFVFSEAKGFSPDRNGNDQVAVFEFSFRDPRRRHPGVLRGVMLAVPADKLQAVPDSQSFFGSTYKMVQKKPSIAIRSWREDELVFVCFVPIEHDEALGDVLSPLAA